MGKHGSSSHNNKKKSSKTSGSSSTSSVKNISKVAVEIKDIKFEESGKVEEVQAKAPSSSAGSGGSTKLEKILSELERGCLLEDVEEKNSVSFGDLSAESSAISAAATADAVGYLRKKMAALGFQAGIQLSGGGAFRDARRILDGFPGDDEYELTFEEVESDEDILEDDEFDDEDSLADLNDLANDVDLLNGSLDGLSGLDPLKVLSSKTAASANANTSATGSAKASGLNYPLIDPLKLQVIQSAESELTTVHDLFESTTISASQKLPLLKRKYMELMQQDIRHRLESLRIRDYLDTLHLERQVVERELEKAVNLRSSMEQLCEKLQAENAKIRAEKAGISAKIYGDLELKALEEELDVASVGSGSGKNSKKKSQKKQQSQSQSQPKTFQLPEANKTVSFEVPDANRLLEGAQGDLRVRFQLLIDLYNQREQHFMTVLRSKDAEIQMLQGHFYSHQGQIQKLSQSNRELLGKVTELAASESDLRAQLTVYVDKFKQVEDTLSKSNDLFATFRHEMEQMTTKVGRLERENSSLQSKCTTLSRNIIEMADERSKQSSALELLKNQKCKLETLCRTLHAERNKLLKVGEGEETSKSEEAKDGSST